MIFLKKNLIGYMRITKGGLSLDEQKEMLSEAGISNFKKDGPVFIDNPKKKTHSPLPKYLEWREVMILGLNNNDTVIVADYSILGVTSGDWLNVVSEIAGKKADLYICSSDEIFHWSEASVKVAKQLASAASKVDSAFLQNKTRNARKAISKSNIRTGPEKSEETKQKIEAAREEWHDPDCKLSGSAIAKKYEIHRNILIREFGNITDCRKQKK